MPSAAHTVITAAGWKIHPPHVSFTTAISGTTVSVNCSASYGLSAPIVLSSWDFGDGATATGVTPSHTYSSTGNYTITYTATQSDGGTASTAKTITISATNLAPTAIFTASMNNLVVSVDASSSSDSDGSIVSYSWNFGDSSTGTGVSTTHTYSAAGSYTITLTVTDNGGATGTQTHVVTTSTGATLGDSGGNGVQQSGSGMTAYTSGSGDFSTRVNTVGSSALCSLPSGTYTFSDFTYDGGGTPPTQFWFGASITAKGIVGAGSNYTTIEMVANTSTKASDVPSQSTGQSNQLQYVYSAANSFTVDNVKILGTTQGHLYNGLRINGVANPTLTNTTVANIPGNAGSPPGETFAVNFQSCTGTVTVTNVTVDGGGLGAAAMGSNNSGATYNITNLYTHDHPYSAGWASWEHTGVMNFHGFVMKNGARAFNAERLVGQVNFYDPLWDDPTSGHYDVNPTYESGWTGGQLNFYFSNASAWSSFTANRTNKTITAVSNSSSVSYGLSKSTVINVYIGGALQTQSNYVTWTGI